MAEHKPEEKSAGKLSLPTLLYSPADIPRLLRELESIEAAVLDSDVRQGDDQIPERSRLMAEVAETNKLDLSDKSDRQALQQQLQDIQKRAPVMHMSFSSDPSPAFIEKLIVWLRDEINPQVLLTIGLRPSIGAGCIVRTTNKYFDFSLRKNLDTKRDLLASKLALSKSEPAPEPVMPEVAA